MGDVVPPCLLILHWDTDLSYYVLENVTPDECRLLTTLDMIHEEDVSRPDPPYVSEERKKALYYAMSALGLVEKSYLEMRGYGTSDIVSAMGKWENARVDSLVKVNEDYAGRIYAVFAFSSAAL